MLGPTLFSIPLGFLIAAPLTALLVRLGRRTGALDSEGTPGHAKELRAVPNIGGIAVAAAALGPLAIGLLVLAFAPGLLDPIGLSGDSFAGRLESERPVWWTLVIGGVVMHVVGLVDDRRALPPLPKLFVQLGVATSVVVVGGLRLFTVLDDFGGAGIALSATLTVTWIVVICNAINFLDNMDGLAGGVAAIAAAIFMAATIINGQWFTATAFGLLCGGLMGFLVFNVPPARIFLGDGGSLVIGWLLAVLTVRTTFVDTADPDFALGTAWYGVLMPVIVLAIPIYDLVSVSLIRIRQGRSPLVGDQQHLSHRLVGLGLSRRSAVLVIWGLSAATGIGGIVLGSVQPWQAVMIGAQAASILLVLGLLESGARRWRDGVGG